MTYSYQIKAINSDSDTCEVCGKSNLKKVVWIVEIDEDGNETSFPVAHGTTCASVKLGFTGSKANKERAITDKISEDKKQARLNYYNQNCNQIPFGNSAVFIDKKYRIGLVMKEMNLSRNEAINHCQQEMKKSNWFLQ